MKGSRETSRFTPHGSMGNGGEISVENGKKPTEATFFADALLLTVAAALSAALLWPFGGRAAKAEPPFPLRPVAWANDRLLPEAITPLSSLYHVSDREERLTLRVEGGNTGTALLVWLEGEWVVMPWEEVPGEYRVSFDGWRPEYVTVAVLPAATRGR